MSQPRGVLRANHIHPMRLQRRQFAVRRPSPQPDVSVNSRRLVLRRIVWTLQPNGEREKVRIAENASRTVRFSRFVAPCCKRNLQRYETTGQHYNSSNSSDSMSDPQIAANTNRRPASRFAGGSAASQSLQVGLVPTHHTADLIPINFITLIQRKPWNGLSRRILHLDSQTAHRRGRDIKSSFRPVNRNGLVKHQPPA